MYLESRRTLARAQACNFRRRETRYIFGVPVMLLRFLRFGPVATRGMTLDISMRGMSALVCGAPRVGETVVIELTLRDTPVEMLATVRHSTDARSGFEFFPLSPIAQEEIQCWIEKLQQHEEPLFPNSYTSIAQFGND